MKAAVERLNEPFPLPLIVPFFQVGQEERRLQFCSQPNSTGLPGRGEARGVRREPFRDLVEQGFHERPQLSVRGGPVPGGVVRNGLVEVAEGRVEEAELLQQRVNLVIRLGQVQDLRQRGAEPAVPLPGSHPASGRMTTRGTSARTGPGSKRSVSPPGQSPPGSGPERPSPSGFLLRGEGPRGSPANTP